LSDARLIAAYAACRAIAKREAKNFYYAFRVLPRHKSDAMCAVYAFMRKADDLADDESMSLDARREAMAAWTAAWRASRNEPTDDPVFIALNDTQQRFQISDELLEQLVAGTTMDLQESPDGVVQYQGTTITSHGKTSESFQIFETFDYLYRYCYLVASVVGLVCIRIFGYSDQLAEKLAEETGIAFQLTNILRDIKEDAERGRIYLPLDDMQSVGLEVEHLSGLVQGHWLPPAALELLQLEIRRAQEYYSAAGELIPLLDADSRPAMRVLIRIYHRLLDRIAADPAAVFRERVSVPTREKLAILVGGAIGSLKVRVLR
jgi:phytoene synthase